MKETDAIFQDVAEVHRRAIASEDILRLSLDAKAPVLIGPFAAARAAGAPGPPTTISSRGES